MIDEQSEKEKEKEESEMKTANDSDRFISFNALCFVAPKTARYSRFEVNSFDSRLLFFLGCFETIFCFFQCTNGFRCFNGNKKC